MSLRSLVDVFCCYYRNNTSGGVWKRFRDVSSAEKWASKERSLTHKSTIQFTVALTLHKFIYNKLPKVTNH